MLGFGANLLYEFFGNIAEWMLHQRQTLLMPILLFVIDLVRQLKSGIVVSGLEGLLDLPAAERIAHGPVSGSFPLEKGKGRACRFGGTLQHNQGSKGVTMVGALR